VHPGVVQGIDEEPVSSAIAADRFASTSARAFNNAFSLSVPVSSTSRLWGRSNNDADGNKGAHLFGLMGIAARGRSRHDERRGLDSTRRWLVNGRDSGAASLTARRAPPGEGACSAVP